jgi:hypothetical protein
MADLEGRILIHNSNPTPATINRGEIDFINWILLSYSQHYQELYIWWQQEPN